MRRAAVEPRSTSAGDSRCCSGAASCSRPAAGAGGADAVAAVRVAERIGEALRSARVE
jgi:hypothetical protein